MFEVLVTYRPDFKEVLLDRYATEEEAQVKASAQMLLYPDKLFRAWVRRAAPAATNHSEPRDNPEA
jgi:hypothetical protein